MTFKLTAWQIYLIILALVYLISSIVWSQETAGSLSVYYLIIGVIVLIIYYGWKGWKIKKEKNS